MSAHILIVEDEEKLARFTELELQHENYEVRKAFDGRAALEEALKNDYDLILLDIMLPGLSGMEVLRRLRQEKNTPVILLTARDSVMDKVAGLDAGAVDYITKPFAIEELLARIRVALKFRSPGAEKTAAAEEGVLSWKHGAFYFEGQTLREILTEIGRWYNLNVIFTTNQHLDDSLHYNADRSWKIQQVVSQLNNICETHIKIKNNNLIVDE